MVPFEILNTLSQNPGPSIAKEDADAWAFLAMARRQVEATRQDALREEEERLAALPARGGATGHCGGAAAEGGGAASTPAQAGEPSRPALRLGKGAVVALAGVPSALRCVQSE
jgi:hypothetical protein